MAFFVQREDGVLVRDAWNFPEAILAEDDPMKIRPFPVDYESLCNTFALVPKLAVYERGHDKDIVLQDHGEAEQSVIVLRLQGYLQRLKLGRLGDWDGNPKNCMTAANTIYLEPGGATHDDQWRASWTALRFVRRWAAAVSHSTCGDNPPSGDMDSIKCTRRAFIKAGPMVPRIDLDQNDSLYFAAQRVRKMWVPERPIGFGIRRPDGRVARANPAIFSQGDFVDVAVSFDVATRDKGRVVHVYPRIEHIIQLATIQNEGAASIRVLQGLGMRPTIERHAPTTVAFAEEEDEQ